MAERKTYIDAVAGIMIIRMIIGHCSFFTGFLLPFQKPLMIFFSFFMPWFFYKSGMFFQPRNQKDLLRKDLYKFVKPFVVYSLIGWIIWSFCGIIGDNQSLLFCIYRPIKDFLHHGSIGGNGALWFLLSLFIVREFANCGLGFTSPLVLSFAGFIVALLLYVIGLQNYMWWFGNIFSGLSFFCLGYWLKDKESRPYLIVVCAILVFVILIADMLGFIEYPSLYMHANRMTRGNYVLFYPISLAGIVVFNQSFRYMESKKFRFYILEYIGRNSMNFYVTHWILFTIVVFVTKHVFHIESAKHLFYILLMSSILCLPLISRLIDTIKSKNKFLNKIL